MKINSGKIIAHARVKIEVEIAVSDSWGADCPISQVHQQAAESAMGVIRHMCEQTKEHRVRICGEPSISAVIVENVP